MIKYWRYASIFILSSFLIGFTIHASSADIVDAAQILPGSDTLHFWLTNHSTFITAISTAALEMVARLWPTVKPAGIIHIVGIVLRKISSICLALADISDQILPQNLK